MSQSASQKDKTMINSQTIPKYIPVNFSDTNFAHDSHHTKYVQISSGPKNQLHKYF